MKTLMTRITTEENLHAAWRRVRANGGGPGEDGVILSRYADDLDRNLSDLAHRLQTETYLPLPLRRASLPKKSGGTRDLHIPTIADRVAQRAFLNVLEPIFDARFLPCSLGYRPGVGVADAVERVLAYRAAGLDWIVDADVSDFFGSVDHGLLMRRVREQVGESSVLRVIGLWLEAGAMDAPALPRPGLLADVAAQIVRAATAMHISETDEYAGEDGTLGEDAARLARQFGAEAMRLAWQHRRVLLPLLAAKGALVGGAVGLAGVAAVGVACAAHRARGRVGGGRRVGTPQGGPISPLLSNIYLHPFDQAISGTGLRLVRYADDFVICCPSEGRAQQARQMAQRELERLHLSLHPDKTRIVACGDLLHFLGYAFDRDGAFVLSESGAACVRRKVPGLPDQARQTVAKAVGGARREGAALLHDLRERRDEMQ